MIKYLEVNGFSEGESLSISYINNIKGKFPIKHIYRSGNIYYSIPFNNTGILHRADGPAIEYSNGIKVWRYYGYKPKSKEEFYEPQWRKLVEIKVFL